MRDGDGRDLVSAPIAADDRTVVAFETLEPCAIRLVRYFGERDLLA